MKRANLHVVPDAPERIEPEVVLRGVVLNAILKFYGIPDLRQLAAADFEGCKQAILNTKAKERQAA